LSASSKFGAQVRKPDDSTLAFLLGLAMGVMLTLSIIELWIKNAMANGWPIITMATMMGAGMYYVLQPLFPEFEVCLNSLQ
jgi:zinc transporter ZupT